MHHVIEPPTRVNEIVTRLGLHRAGGWWRGSCPACGKDALSAADGRKGLRLTCHYGCDPDTVRQAIGGGAMPTRDAEDGQRKADAKAVASEAARRIWNGADPVTAGDPAGRYLASRHLHTAIDNPALRYRRDVPHPSGSRWPAMLCRVDGPDGEMVAVHRVFLTLDGGKAKLDPVKAAKGPIWTGAIRFGTGPEIVIAEGPETAFAAGIILGLPAWSAISAGNLAKGLMLPPEVRSVTIAADHDQPGIEAAEHAARHWQVEGRKVRIVKPDRPGDDFADVLMQRAGDCA